MNAFLHLHGSDVLWPIYIYILARKIFLWCNVFSDKSILVTHVNSQWTETLSPHLFYELEYYFLHIMWKYTSMSKYANNCFKLSNSKLLQKHTDESETHWREAAFLWICIFTEVRIDQSFAYKHLTETVFSWHLWIYILNLSWVSLKT